MAIYGVDFYGTAFYGYPGVPTPPTQTVPPGKAIVSFDASPFVAEPVGEDALEVSWNLPGGNWTGMILTRSTTGFPVDQLPMSGEVLFDTTQQNLAVITNSITPATPQQVYPYVPSGPSASSAGVVSDRSAGTMQETWTLVESNPFYAAATPQVPTSYFDTSLTPGKFYYYSIFVFSLEEATPGWRLAGNCIGLVAEDFGYKNRLFELMPEVYQQQDQALTTANTTAGPLERFLQLFGSQLNLVRTEYETLRDIRTPQRMSGGLLPLLAATLGTGYESAIGMRQARYKLANIVHLYKLKGTRLGVEGITNAISGWDCAVDVSYNMLYDKNTSSFFEPFAATPQATPATPQNPTTWVGKPVTVTGLGAVIRTYIDRILNPYLDHLKDDLPAKWLNNRDLDLDGRTTVNIHNQILRVRRNATAVTGDDSLVVTHSQSGLGHLTGVKIRPTRDDDRRPWDWDDFRDKDHVKDHDDDDDICRHRHRRLVDVDKTRVQIRIDEWGRVENRPTTLRTEGLDIRVGNLSIDIDEGQGAIDEKTVRGTIRVGVSGQALITHDPSTASRQAHCYLDYYDKVGVYISSSPAGSLVNTVATQWVQVSVIDPKPPDAAVHAALVIEWLHVGTVDIHYYKSVQIEVGCHRDDDDEEHLMIIPRIAEGQAPFKLSVTVAKRTANYKSWRIIWGDGTPDLTGVGRVKVGTTFTHTYTSTGHFRLSFRGTERDGDVERGHCKVHVSGPTMIYSSDEGVSASNGTLTTLSPFALARNIRIRMAPTRANEVPNPSFENDMTMWSPVSMYNLILNPGAAVDTSNWTAQSSTLTRTTAVSQAGPAAFQLQCTSTAAGNMTMTSNNFGVQQGVQLHVEAFVMPATTVRTVYVQVDWKDANLTYLSTTGGTHVAEVAGSWTHLLNDFTPPANAAFADVGVVVLSPALNEIHYVDTTAGTQPTNFITSRVPVPVPNPDIPYSQYCLGAYTLWPTGATGGEPTPLNDIDLYVNVPVLPLTPYALSAYFLSSGEMRNVTCEIEYLDAHGNSLTKATWSTYDHIMFWADLAGRSWQSIEENWLNNAFAVDRAGQWVRAGIITVAPDVAHTANLHLIVQAPSPYTMHYIDGALFEKLGDFEPYFDASALPGSLDYIWGGTPHASTSYWYPHRATKNNRLNQALPDFIPAGSTFSLIYGSDA